MSSLSMSMNSQQFGQRRPPLSVTIKGILERYPDGQIFKEMIQNADDAGAKTVWFYVDERQHGSANLPLPALDKFQGPALVAANDARFTEADWEGIQSLQQSIKADDPFKVGRFGIGFNSVYHLTDLPIIVSGDRLACFEPQEIIWKGESGQSFTLKNLISQQSDMVAPLAELANFTTSTFACGSSYSHTLFRLPLRTQPSSLSDNVYTVAKLNELLDALREEAKFLLLFLKSVNKIEVIHVSQSGQQSLSFCVEISPTNKQEICTHRESFMEQLQTAHSKQPYKISKNISYTARFTVVVKDQNLRHNQAGSSEWLVANCVGSSDASVQSAAQQQKIFPWVGAALELSNLSGKGRIFCFLPMPVEASSGLPIHVNGTFGLNDERRSLKWPGIERRNDPTANWNKTIVSKLLPHCYALLLLEAKKHLSSEQFYQAWPHVDLVKRTPFVELMQPLFASLFQDSVDCVYSERTVTPQQVGEWINISQAIFISEGSTLDSVVCQALSNCGVKLVEIPSTIWKAIHYNKLDQLVTKLSPKLARASLRSYPHSYSNIDHIGKRELLRYCLSDRCYQELNGLNLLPLANNTFTNFDTFFGTQLVYLCTSDCPRYLLPNLEHLLVDVLDDRYLYSSLSEVASSQQTKLRILTEREVSQLLPLAMPSSWQRSSLVPMPDAHLPATWFETFWKWLQNKNLQLFQNQHIVPVFQSSQQHRASYDLTQLTAQSSVLCISRYDSCSDAMLSALYKMNVMVFRQSEFSIVQHRQIASYVKQYDTNGVLDTIAHQSAYSSATFTSEEADALRTFFVTNTYTPNQQRRAVLQSLSIFSCSPNSSSKLCSYTHMWTQSLARKALGEPASTLISVASLPRDLLLFSRSDYHQLQLLEILQVTFPTDTRLIMDHIFPLIDNRYFPDDLIDGLMMEIIDNYQSLWSKDHSLATLIQGLPFLKTASGVRKSPKNLFDPSNETVSALYEREDVFPLSPFNTPHRLHVLTYCGLGTSVSPQQVLDIIYSISANSSSQPQRVTDIKYRRTKAVLEYISTNEFRQLPSGTYKSPYSGNYSFSKALHTLATNRSWLPVMSDHPEGYPDELNWKGSNLDYHFVSLNTSVAVISTDTVKSLPFLVGTQMYLVTPAVHLTIASWLPTPPDVIVRHIIAHFEEFKVYKDHLSVNERDMQVHRVYKYLNDSSSFAMQLYSKVQEWIFIKKEQKFVCTDVVALNHNQTFRQSLEPYIYILPDTLSQYTTLFSSESGVSHSVSQSQIVSVLAMIQKNTEAVHSHSSSEEAWTTVMSILNWLTDSGTREVHHIEVLVPIESNSKWPQLKEASKLVYTDNDFLKNYLQESEERGLYVFVHDKINPSLAKSLGVQPLSEFLDISADTFEDAGQHEPLTTRLKNILRDYKDGLTILKELLQNADDAEATEVNICYDSRQHERNPKKLFFSGMSEAHGPALIVHNNKTFTDDDFTNITKLAAATKHSKALKIGKFGVGFCSVYHMTDVPSFISRDRLYIFDPTLSYLKKEIKNPAQPGKKVTFTKKIISRSSQLSPYDGLFGFDRSSSTYEGTMFRFPFRTSASELSGTCYSKSTVQDLIMAIQKSSSSLLLFLQHVKCVTFQQIQSGETSPTVLFKVTRDCVPMPLALPSGVEVRQLYSQTSSDSSTWLVSQKNEYDSMGKYCTASVACPLKQARSSSSFEVDPSFQGEIFCFLPLSQKTGLPVHVSSNFAVINNRRGIWTSDHATTQTDPEVEWNVALMQGVIPTAYHTLLVALKQMKVSGSIHSYLFHCLWPLTEKLEQHNPWSLMIPQLYQKISSDELLFSSYKNEWLPLTASKFLQTGILSSDSSGTPTCVLKVVQHLNLPIVDLPSQYHIHFNLQKFIIHESVFSSLFFKKLDSLRTIIETRSEVIRHMLEVYAAEYDDGTSRSYELDDYFKKYPCVPCTPDGTILRYCTEVMDPSATFSKLFDPDEGRFPIDEIANRHLCWTALCDLGMCSKTIPMSLLVERAQTVSELFTHNKTKALSRVKLILSSTSKIENISTGIKGKSKKQVAASPVQLSSIAFLPVLPKPAGYHLSWKGQDCVLMSGKELMIVGPKSRHGEQEVTNAFLAGSEVAFVNELASDKGGCGHISQEAARLLELRTSPSCDEVIEHLKRMITFFNSHQITKELAQNTDRMCRNVYSFLNRKITFEHKLDSTSNFTNVLVQQPILQTLQTIPCVWTGQQFLPVEVIAEQWSIDGPYLYPVPSSLSIQANLTQALKIKKDFSLDDVRRALAKMKQDFGTKSVNERCQVFLKALVSLLLNLDTQKFTKCTIMLPDENFVLHESDHLVYNDVDWAPKDSKYVYVNDIISPSLAKQLHVKPARTYMLNKYSSGFETHFRGVPFGQHEQLTRRIQNILRDYPFDITVLKELLQNADDAKATKMYVILDERSHDTKGVLSERWAELQGPALLVWNDSTFSEKDLKGIQELGLGSKKSDAESIGQYGIGFNVVYHLTDCPSFITGGETMCILDPHCKYVDGADEVKPGRRFDNLSSGFWKDFPQMKSTYLQGGLENCPSELSRGSLFRFPLRHTPKHVRESKIVQRDRNGLPIEKPLTSQDLHRNVHLWAPKMKEAMLFLNNVTELRFFVIKENKQTLSTMRHYRSKVHHSAQEHRDKLHQKLSAFQNVKGNESCVIRYPLTISEVHHSPMLEGESTTDEKWLIQQGVGDIENEQQIWSYIDTVKPRHGIAAPIQLPPKPKLSTPGTSVAVEPERFVGQIFCFLPLPVESKLPVHINGHFILDSNRRHLWSSTETEREDDRSVWNRRIFEAIASSYANLLGNIQSFYVNSTHYKTWYSASEAITNYCNIFPAGNLNKVYSSLANSVFAKLVSHNSSVFAVIRQNLSSNHQLMGTSQLGGTFTVDWHPTKSGNASTQIYFWSSPTSMSTEDRKQVKTILESIGMKLTASPWWLQVHFNKVIKEEKDKLQHTTPKTVFDYYIRFCYQVTPTCQFPCPLTDTVFKNILMFKKFTEYLLQPPTEVTQLVSPRLSGFLSLTSSQLQEKKILHFPDQPYCHPLLLTADGKLRNFQENKKVMKSEFSALFPKSQDKFLHPGMFSIPYSSDYFIQHSLTDNSYSLRLVSDILNNHLPYQLKTTRLCQYEKYLTREELVNYWKCLSSDPTFSSQLLELLKVWALLPARGGTLYSCNDPLIPVIPPNSPPIYQVLVDLGMPFLDISIVGIAPPCCPCLDDYKAILKALFHLNQEKDLSTDLNPTRVGIVLEYLSNIDFRKDQTCLNYVKSLPLFESIDCSYISLKGKTAFVWPAKALSVGYLKWAHCFPNIIFLQEVAVCDWTILGSAEQLQIDTISAEDVYCNYIFRTFSNLDEPERYQHLAHIKDDMFTTNNHHKKKKGCDNLKSRAITFIQALENLPCLGKEGEQLKSVGDHCNHDKDIFTTFGKHFKFVPDFFKRDEDGTEWLQFFKEIGLQQAISQEKFIELCKETAGGHHDNPIRASKVLLQHLISESVKKAGWHSDQRFLRQVSDIEFVPTEPLHDLCWIRQAVTLSHSLIVNGIQYSFAKLCESAVPETSLILWTVKPIVNFAGYYYSTTYNEHCTLLNHMGVTSEPKVAEVIHNIRNICTLPHFTDFKLFDQYPGGNKPPKGAKSLMEVMIKLFEFLSSKQVTLDLKDDIAVLKNTPCIPVYSTAQHTHNWQVVLVKPSCVLTCDVPGCHPFLHRLPRELMSVATFLQEIGVRNSIQLSHTQIVLETAYICSEGQELSDTTKRSVFTAIKYLIRLLSSSLPDSKEALKPLYLPTHDKKLALSTNLLYVDNDSFKGKLKPKLDSTSYSMLSVHSSDSLIMLYERDFCNLLPKEIRPKGLSEMCTQTVLEECKHVADSNVALGLKETIGMTVMLPKAIAACVQYFTKDNSVCETIEACVLEFLSTIEVITLDRLRMAITFKETEEPLGNLDTKFFLDVTYSSQSSPTRRYLYLDTNFKLDKNGFHLYPLLGALSRELLSVIREVKHISIEVYQNLQRKFLEILTAKEPDEVRQILEMSDIPLEAAHMDDLTFKLGKEIPECWHCRLDQTIENVFHPGEIVGYENMEDHIIIAQIMHPVLPEGVHSFESVSRISMTYRIFISPEDEEGIEVSVIYLYKFLRGLKKEKVINKEEKDLIPYEGETPPVQLQQKLLREDIEEIKSQLFRQLNEVWKLPSKDQERAIRRLCLKWHPDKNLDDPTTAEIIFKFLVSEVEKRKGGRFTCSDLDRTARRQRDQERAWSRSGGGDGSEGSDDNEAFGGTSWGGQSPSFSEEKLQPQRNPEKGKIWVEQAEANFQTLVLLHAGSHNNPKVCADVCFMAHQVAEKALKGGKYFVCGLGEKGLKSHNISTHAYGLQAERPGEAHGLVAHTLRLEVYYLKSRYPNCWPNFTVPADMYSFQQANEARKHAEAILNIIKDILKNI